MCRWQWTEWAVELALLCTSFSFRHGWSLHPISFLLSFSFSFPMSPRLNPVQSFTAGNQWSARHLIRSVGARGSVVWAGVASGVLLCSSSTWGFVMRLAEPAGPRVRRGDQISSRDIVTFQGMWLKNPTTTTPKPCTCYNETISSAAMINAVRIL